MKKLFVLVLICITLLCMPAIASAGTVNVPEEMLTQEQKAQLYQQDIAQKVEQYGSWVGLGEEVGKAVDSSLSALTNRSEEFSNTKVGVFTMFIIAYKVLGTDIIQLMIGLPLLLFMIIIWAVSFYKNCIPHRIVMSTEGSFWSSKKTYKLTGVDDTMDGAQRWAYAFVLAAIIGVAAIVIFA